jgi:hypothetical protein
LTVKGTKNTVITSTQPPLPLTPPLPPLQHPSPMLMTVTTIGPNDCRRILFINAPAETITETTVLLLVLVQPLLLPPEEEMKSSVHLKTTSRRI